MESKSRRQDARAKSKHFKEEDSRARSKVQRDKEIAQEIIRNYPSGVPTSKGHQISLINDPVLGWRFVNGSFSTKRQKSNSKLQRG